MALPIESAILGSHTEGNKPMGLDAMHGRSSSGKKCLIGPHKSVRMRGFSSQGSRFDVSFCCVPARSRDRFPVVWIWGSVGADGFAVILRRSWAFTLGATAGKLNAQR